MIIEIRKHMHGAWIFALAMGLSFAVGPVINLVRLLRMRTNAVAIVNGIPVTPEKVQQANAAYDAYYRSLKMLGLERFIKKLSTQEILESCISDILKGTLASNLAIEVHDKELASRLAKEIGQRYVADGVFDKERYSSEILASTGMKMSQYEAKIREQISHEALDKVLAMACPDMFIAQEQALARRFTILTFDVKSVKSELESAGLDQNDLLIFYNANSRNYLSEEERSFKTLWLKEELFKEHVLITDDELLDYYQASIATSFTKPARYAVDVWEVSIEGLSEIEAAQLTDRMVDLQKNLVQSGFVGASKKELKDIAFYSKGLDEATKMGVDPVLASAIIDLKAVGSTTEVLKSDKKCFFARVTAYVEPEVVPFEQAKNEILPILEKRALSVSLREEVEDLIKEARESENGSEILAQEAAKFNLKTRNVSSDDGKEADDFKNSSEVQPGLIGCIAKEGGYLVYSLVSFKPREVLPFQEVIAEVREDFLVSLTRNKMEALALEIKQQILSGLEYESFLSKWKGSKETTSWIEANEKFDGLELSDCKKAHKMSQVGAEALIVPLVDSIKIITLAETRDGKKADPEVKQVDIFAFDSKSDSRFSQAVVSSDQRSAKIDYSDPKVARQIEIEDF